jgi:cytochrome c oxidase subunit 2
MIPQYLAWYISLVLVVVLTLRFIYTAFSNGPVAGGEKHTAHLSLYGVYPDPYLLRRILLFSLIGLGVVITVVTVPPPPYTAQNQPPQGAQEVDVVGAMWYWQLSPAQVQSGRPVLFKVTSADVNHGLGIYDQDLRLLTQTQAMPGYVNKLAYTFTQPGTYRIMCLEYCGLVHHGMIGELEVIAAEEGNRP